MNNVPAKRHEKEQQEFRFSICCCTRQAGATDVSISAQYNALIPKLRKQHVSLQM
jgi:hypothetical protein